MFLRLASFEEINSEHPASASSLCADRSFRALRESLSLAWPRERNQREGHPSSSHSGHPAQRVRARWPLVYGRTSLCVRRLAASMRPHFVLFAPTDHRRSGAPTSTEARSSAQKQQPVHGHPHCGSGVSRDAFALVPRGLTSSDEVELGAFSMWLSNTITKATDAVEGALNRQFRKPRRSYLWIRFYRR